MKKPIAILSLIFTCFTTQVRSDSSLTELTNVSTIGEWIQYNAGGQGVKCTYSDGTDESFQHALDGVLAQSISSSGRCYDYNPKGQLSETTRPDGVVLYYSYDQTERLCECHSNDHSIAYSFVYDQQGYLTRSDDHISGKSSSRVFDAAGNILEETLANGLTLKNIYDDQGKRSCMILPDGSSVSYQYEQRNLRLIQRFNRDGQLQYSHEYCNHTPGGSPTNMCLIGQAGLLSLEYDSFNRCTEIVSNQWQEKIPAEGFDPAGNLVSLMIEDPGGEWTGQFSYDDYHQLIEERGSFVHSYTYDQHQNRISKDELIQTVDDLDQLILQIAGDQTTQYQYDKRGNLIEKKDKEETIYSYDALDRLVSVEIKGVQRVSFSYDAFHRRL